VSTFGTPDTAAAAVTMLGSGQPWWVGTWGNGGGGGNGYGGGTR